MRVIDQAVRTFGSIVLGGGPSVQNSTILPEYGSGALAGFWIDLLVSIAGGTHSQASNTIDNVIQQIETDDNNGNALMVAHGTDLSVLNDFLQPRGVRQVAPAITTDGSGNGSAEWYFFLPVTIAAAQMPAQLKLIFAATSSLVNGSLTSAGTVTVTLIVRAAYPVGEDRQTLYITMSNPPHQQGDVQVGPYLPAGFQEEAFGFVLTGGDGDFGYLSVLQGGGSLAYLEPLNDFISNDTMLMQSGHLSGEFICRFPTFMVDNTTVVTINLTTDTAIRLYSIATKPQQRGK